MNAAYVQPMPVCKKNWLQYWTKIVVWIITINFLEKADRQKDWQAGKHEWMDGRTDGQETDGQNDRQTMPDIYLAL